MSLSARHTETEARRSTMLRTAFCPVVREALEAPDTIEVMANPDGSVWIEKAGVGVIISPHTLAPCDRERVIRLVASGAEEAAGRASPEVTGQYLLIPQGSRLIGRYQSKVSFGQDRALVTWDRIIFPDRSSILISAPGADAQGFAGLSDRTDHHWDRVFVAAGLATILGVGAELGADGDGDLERAIRRGTTDTVNQAGQRVVERNLGIQPTIRIRPGWPVRVVVTRDLILRPHPQGTSR